MDLSALATDCSTPRHTKSLFMAPCGNECLDLDALDWRNADDFDARLFFMSA
jgi:hypothetical protein